MKLFINWFLVLVNLISINLFAQKNLSTFSENLILVQDFDKKEFLEKQFGILYPSLIDFSVDTLTHFKYLNQLPPGKVPIPFAEEIFSKRWAMHHSNICFSPDGKEALWHGREVNLLPNGQRISGIYYSSYKNGKWSEPLSSEFFSRYDDSPVYNSNGQKIFFVTYRSLNGNERNDYETIWTADKNINGWSNPKPLSDKINSLRLIHWGISLDDKDNLYFGVRPTMNLNDGYNGDIYVSGFDGVNYGTPKKLSKEVNIDGYKFSPFISPNGDYLLFTHIGNKDDHYKILLSYKLKNGDWSKAVEINNLINMKNEDITSPYVTRDGKYFFFIHIKNNFSKIYWVSSSFIDELK